jgi:endoglycosylceramidase
MNQFIKFITLTLLISFSCSSFISIDKNSRHFVDIEGRVRVFHGLNIVIKNPPYVPIEDHFDPLFSLTEEDLDYLTEFGFNVVRLGVIWEAVETSPGVYDQVYLDTYERIINKLGERGIYTILDSHQDMFSRILCGEGVPVFYAKNLLYNTKCGEKFA